MGGRRVSPEKVQVLLDCLTAGMNPLRASRAAGVSPEFAYKLDRQVSGESRLAAKRAGMSARAGFVRSVHLSRNDTGRRRDAPPDILLTLTHNHMTHRSVCCVGIGVV